MKITTKDFKSSLFSVVTQWSYLNKVFEYGSTLLLFSPKKSRGNIEVDA